MSDDLDNPTDSTSMILKTRVDSSDDLPNSRPISSNHPANANVRDPRDLNSPLLFDHEGKTKSVKKNRKTAPSEQKSTLLDNMETLDYTEDNSRENAEHYVDDTDHQFFDTLASPIPTMEDMLETGVRPEYVYGMRPLSHMFDPNAMSTYDMHLSFTNADASKTESETAGQEGPRSPSRMTNTYTRARTMSTTGEATSTDHDVHLINSLLHEMQTVMGHDFVALDSNIPPNVEVVPPNTQSPLTIPSNNNSNFSKTYQTTNSDRPSVPGASAGSSMNSSSGSRKVEGEDYLLTESQKKHKMASTNAQLRFLDSSWPSLMRYVICLLIGVSVALSAYIIEIAIHLLYDVVLGVARFCMSHNGGINYYDGKFSLPWMLVALITIIPIAAFYGIMGVITCFYGGFYPVRGSGIPHLNAYLDGSYNTKVPIFTFRVLVTKAVSVTLALACGIKAGLQGPIIHLGGLIGRQLSKFVLNVLSHRYFSNILRVMCCCFIDKKNRFRSRPCQDMFTFSFRYNNNASWLGSILAYASQYVLVKLGARPALVLGQYGQVTDNINIDMNNSVYTNLPENSSHQDGAEIGRVGVGLVNAGVSGSTNTDNPFSSMSATNIATNTHTYNHMGTMGGYNQGVGSVGPGMGSGDISMHTFSPLTSITTSFYSPVSPITIIAEFSSRLQTYSDNSISCSLKHGDDVASLLYEYDHNCSVVKNKVFSSNISSYLRQNVTDSEDERDPFIETHSPSVENKLVPSAATVEEIILDQRDTEYNHYYANLLIIDPAIARPPPTFSALHNYYDQLHSTTTSAKTDTDLDAVSSRLTVMQQLALLSKCLTNPTDEHDFLACGAAAGFTCTFNAPLAGMITVQGMLKQTNSWQLPLRMFFTCLIAIVVTNLLNATSSVLPDRGFIDPDVAAVAPMSTIELYICVFLGLFGGLLAALFSKINIIFQHFRVAHFGHKLVANLQYVVLVAVAIMVPSIVLSIFMSCTPVNANSFPVCQDHVNRCFQLSCPPGHFSEIGTLLFQYPGQTVRLLWDRSELVNEFKPITLAVFAPLYFILSCASYMVAVPGGFFMPAIILGGIYGRVLARIFMMFIPSLALNIGVYGALGSITMLVGINRLTLPMAVMMVEFTSDVQFLTPIMIVIICSKFVADSLVGGIEGEEMKLRQTYMSMGEKPNVILTNFNALELLLSSGASTGVSNDINSLVIQDNIMINNIADSTSVATLNNTPGTTTPNVGGRSRASSISVSHYPSTSSGLVHYPPPVLSSALPSSTSPNTTPQYRSQYRSGSVCMSDIDSLPHTSNSTLTRNMSTLQAINVNINANISHANVAHTAHNPAVLPLSTTPVIYGIHDVKTANALQHLHNSSYLHPPNPNNSNTNVNVSRGRSASIISSTAVPGVGGAMMRNMSTLPNMGGPGSSMMMRNMSTLNGGGIGVGSLIRNMSTVGGMNGMNALHSPTFTPITNLNTNTHTQSHANIEEEERYDNVYSLLSLRGHTHPFTTTNILRNAHTRPTQNNAYTYSAHYNALHFGGLPTQIATNIIPHQLFRNIAMRPNTLPISSIGTHLTSMLNKYYLTDPYLNSVYNDWHDAISVNNMIAIGEVDTIARISAIFSNTSYAMFPVVSVLPVLNHSSIQTVANNQLSGTPINLHDNSGFNAGTGVLLGVITRKNLELLLQKSLDYSRVVDNFNFLMNSGLYSNNPAAPQPQPEVSRLRLRGRRSKPTRNQRRNITKDRLLSSPFLRFNSPYQALHHHSSTRSRAFLLLCILYRAIANVYAQKMVQHQLNKSKTEKPNPVVAELKKDIVSHDVSKKNHKDEVDETDNVLSHFDRDSFGSLDSFNSLGADLGSSGPGSNDLGISLNTNTGLSVGGSVKYLTPLQRMAYCLNAITSVVVLPPVSRTILDKIIDLTLVEDIENNTNSHTHSQSHHPTDREREEAVANKKCFSIVEYLEDCVDRHNKKAYNRSISNEANLFSNSEANTDITQLSQVMSDDGLGGISGNGSGGDTNDLRRSESLIRRNNIADVMHSIKSNNVPHSPDQNLWLNVSSLMTTDVTIAPTNTPANKIWRWFRSIGMKRIVLVDNLNRPVGVLTRKDVILGERAIVQAVQREQTEQIM